jgi:biotin carboxyl carrier protein
MVEEDPRAMTSSGDGLRLVDDLTKLLEGSSATTIEVETETLKVTVTRRSAGTPPPATASSERSTPSASTERVRRVRATTVGIFSAPREWQKGDAVARGTILGAIQSLGHMVDIAAPTDGKIEEVLVAIGAPVEYGQALFAIGVA